MRPNTHGLKKPVLAAVLALGVLGGACGDDPPAEPKREAVAVTTTSTTTTIPPTTTTEPPRIVPQKASRAAVAPRPRPAPVATSSLDDAFWRRLANCESPTNSRSRNGKYGGYFQFSDSSWRGAGGTGRPEDHSYEEQLARAKYWASITNPWKQWPVCWRKAYYG